MNTARDLAILTLDMASDHTVEQGDLSLALAAAEMFDLLDAHALVLDGDLITPSAQAPTGDRLLDEAASALVRQEPYESLEDWLWRRGRGLSTAYAEDLERAGLTARAPGPRFTLRAAPSVPVDSAARRQAEERWTSGEPVLSALGTAAGIRDESDDVAEKLTDETVTTVLAALGNAVMELEAVRQRRAIEDAAFDNVWRGY